MSRNPGRSPEGHGGPITSRRSPSIFVEHGDAPDERVAEWQRRLEPLNKRLAGGCHLTRRISESIENAGFTLEQLDTYYFKGEPKPFGYTFEGRAAKQPEARAGSSRGPVRSTGCRPLDPIGRNPDD